MAVSDGGRRRDPSDLSIEAAAERFIGRKRGGAADATVREYGYRLRRFREWATEAGVETVGELHPLDFDDYLAHREAAGIKPLTIQSQFKTIRDWVRFLESLGAVSDDLHEAVPNPDVPKGAEINEVKLDPGDGDALIRYYRQSDDHYGTRQHAILEVIWFTGARLGAVRGLDLGDVWLDETAIAFRHRPEQDTPLKNGPDGERVVAVSPAVADVLREYVDTTRYERRDDYGRQPLITSHYGRAGTNAIRNWCYLATQPCVRAPCPHDRKQPTCEYRDSNQASGCPSSRSPHQIRTGAITRMLNRSDKDRVEYRANTSEFDHYDMATEREKMELRDRDVADDLALDSAEEDDTSDP